MFQLNTLTEKKLPSKVTSFGHIRVSQFWLPGTREWQNMVFFRLDGLVFYFHEEDFGSLRAAFIAARDMRRGLAPEEMTPVTITQLRASWIYTVKPEYVIEMED